VLRTIVMLFFSNLFMTFAWYGHLKNFNNKPFIVCHIFQLEHRFLWIRFAGARQSDRLSILQPGAAQGYSGSDHHDCFRRFCDYVHEQPLKLDFLWAGLCLVGAVLLYVPRRPAACVMWETSMPIAKHCGRKWSTLSKEKKAWYLAAYCNISKRAWDYIRVVHTMKKFMYRQQIKPSDIEAIADIVEESGFFPMRK